MFLLYIALGVASAISIKAVIGYTSYRIGDPFLFYVHYKWPTTCSTPAGSNTSAYVPFVGTVDTYAAYAVYNNTTTLPPAETFPGLMNTYIKASSNKFTCLNEVTATVFTGYVASFTYNVTALKEHDPKVADCPSDAVLPTADANTVWQLDFIQLPVAPTDSKAFSMPVNLTTKTLRMFNYTNPKLTQMNTPTVLLNLTRGVPNVTVKPLVCKGRATNKSTVAEYAAGAYQSDALLFDDRERCATCFNCIDTNDTKMCVQMVVPGASGDEYFYYEPIFTMAWIGKDSQNRQLQSDANTLFSFKLLTFGDAWTKAYEFIQRLLNSTIPDAK